MHGHSHPHRSTGVDSLDRGETHVHHHLGHGGVSKKLLIALLLTLSFAAVQAVVGWWAHSLALLADAAHMMADSTALGLAAAAAWLARRPPSLSHSYGFVRAEVLVALFNGVLMLALIGFIVHEAFQRLGAPRDVAAGAVVGVGLLGLGVNLLVAWVLSRGEATLNSRAALLHVIGDALGSVAAIASGIVILATGWTPIDPILSLFVALLIFISALRLLREVLHVLMEGVPGHIHLETVGRDLAALPGVIRVHDLHVWTLSSGTVALSAHLEIRDLADWPKQLAASRALLSRRYAITHVTLQPEALIAAPLLRHDPPPPRS